MRAKMLLKALCLCFFFTDLLSLDLQKGRSMSLAMQIISVQQNKQILYITLEDNSASKDFIAQLPLELEFSDYANKEKIAHLPKALGMKNTPGYEPQIGDFFYFSPWGNVGIFYDKQPPFEGLVYLGKIVDSGKSDGVEILKNIKGDFRVKITK